MTTFTPKGTIHGPILPEFILKRPISMGAKLMYAVLCNYASEKDHCWPSQATLARKLNCCQNTIKNHLAELRKEKLIQDRKEQYRSSVYYLILPEEYAQMQQQTKQPNFDANQPKIDPGQPKIGYLNTLRNFKKNTPPLPPKKETLPKPIPALNTSASREWGGTFSPDFENIWNLYPKKKAKGFAHIIWQKLLKSKQLPSLDVLRSSIERSIASEDWQREQGRFIPLLNNWLLGQRWLDECTDSKPVSVPSKPITKTKEQEAAIKAREEHERIQDEKRQAERERLRPEFKKFAAKFSQPFPEAMAFGAWFYCHSQNLAPTADDVPDNNTLGIIKFIEEFKNRRKAVLETASNQPHASTEQRVLPEKTQRDSSLPNKTLEEKEKRKQELEFSTQYSENTPPVQCNENEKSAQSDENEKPVVNSQTLLPVILRDRPAKHRARIPSHRGGLGEIISPSGERGRATPTKRLPSPQPRTRQIPTHETPDFLPERNEITSQQHKKKQKTPFKKCRKRHGKKQHFYLCPTCPRLPLTHRRRAARAAPDDAMRPYEKRSPHT